MYLDKSVLGCRYGSSRPQRDIARHAALYRAGRLLLDEPVTRTYPVEDFAETVPDAERGRVARGVLLFGPPDRRPPEARARLLWSRACLLGRALARS